MFIFFFVGANAQDNDWRSQYVKWNLGVNYGLGKVEQNPNGQSEYYNKFSTSLSVDVALIENDVFDSSPLYLQPFIELSLPVKNPYNSGTKFSTYSGGVHLKKHINSGNFKSNFFVFGGGKLQFVVWDLKYGENKNYRHTEMDYVLSAGGGFVFFNQLELSLNYSKGLSNAYYSANVYDGLKKMNSINMGIRFTLANNWWFSNK
ncbi:hypothetical protein LPB90_18555 [Chryseobacterium sp. LC2016-29]|uniref:hypothetical protein n=1 Tax=Chryseobacterium sp. LC2016-29 TaxID=2897331 RepID=UPI001E5F9424|nr:hypothetical protein [Chryseobacterium sp. LC2016-29]MCD0480445.1 hypothetical protein [Chryseobacterium sp. LC2016-29]